MLVLFDAKKDPEKGIERSLKNSFHSIFFAMMQRKTQKRGLKGQSQGVCPQEHISEQDAKKDPEKGIESSN